MSPRARGLRPPTLAGVVLLGLVLASCASRPDPEAGLTPTEPWLTGPPEPMQVIGPELSRLLLAVPPDHNRGLRYTALPARGVFVQKLDDGAILYARYVETAHLPTRVEPPALADSLYRRPLAQRTGIPDKQVQKSAAELPFGTAHLLEARGAKVGCVAFFAPLRVGKDAPPGTWDATLRGAWCQPPTIDVRAALITLLRSLVLRE
ncbi:hypothetical protein [Pararhodospirillum photometricum]|uniref:Lipoprotein n=1 Tax=Pararhodospirillum photometricum DSM 122 TaxID=1150469 RepID=H6SPM6_PARPM|nr:hypothetical protein [Pararhodospirillum photometricum]CCG09551.1 Putative uncharacterized protein [Pararhodospirillum photometricum DSM 122]